MYGEVFKDFEQCLSEHTKDELDDFFNRIVDLPPSLKDLFDERVLVTIIINVECMQFYLETNRLILREIRETDIDGMFELDSKCQSTSILGETSY